MLIKNTVPFSSNYHNNKTSNKHNAPKGYTAEVIATIIASSIAKQAHKITSKNFAKASSGLSFEQKEIVNSGAEHVLKNITNLSNKGVQIIDFNPNDGLNLYELEYYKQAPKTYNEVAKGANAFFSSKHNIVALNKEKLPISSFHELGHAFNYNCSPFWKTIQKLRQPLVYIAGATVLLPARMKEIKPKAGQELTFEQKLKNNLKKYMPLIVGGCMLPTLTEEAMATIRGNAWAKDVLKSTPELTKKVSKTNKWGFISYAIVTACLMLTSFIAGKTRDLLDKKDTATISTSISQKPISFNDFLNQKKQNS